MSQDRSQSGPARDRAVDQGAATGVLPPSGPDPVPDEPVGPRTAVPGNGSRAMPTLTQAIPPPAGQVPGRTAPPGRPSATLPRPERADAARPTGRRKVRLALTHVDVWSVFLLSALVSLFLGVVLLVAVGAVYAMMDTLGVLSSLDSFAQELRLLDPGQSVLDGGRVMLLAGVIAAVDVVLLTLLATLGALLYNVCATLTGGVEVTLSQRD